MSSPLSDLVVLDLTTGSAGALATMLLSDLGARVLRAVSPAAPLFRDGGFVVWDRGKEAISLDITTPQGRWQLDALIPGLDVLIEDQPPSSPLQACFDAGRLKSLNPHLIACSITAYGMQGPLRDLPPDDDLVLARTGMLWGIPGFHGSPIHLVHRIPSVAAAACACAGIGARLYARELCGLGGRVETSLMAATLFFLPKVSGPAVTPQKFQRHPSGTEPFYGVYECSDGRFINLGCATHAFIMACAELLGLAERVREPRFNNGRVYIGDTEGMPLETENELRAAIAEAFRTRSSAEWARAFTESDIPFALVSDDEACLDDPQVLHNGAACTLQDPRLGALTQFGALSDFGATPMRPQGPRSAVAHDPPALAPIRLEIRADRPADALPLAGIRVLEISNIVAGPAVGRMLAELGADVVKLEPPGGDLARGWGGRTYLFHLNADKRGICIDPRKPAAGEIIARLVGHVDAVVANVRPGATERMGVTRERNPNLLESHVTAYGWTGPYAKRPGLDPMAQAMTGFHLAQRGEGNPPTCLNMIGPTDYACGILAAFNLAVGLYVRRRHGTVQRIAINLLSAGMLLNSAWCTRYAGKPERPLTDREQRGFGAFHRLYPLKDGWIYLAADEDDEQRRLLDWLGLQAADAAVTRIAEALAPRQVAETLAALAGIGVPAAEAARARSEVFLDDPHALASDVVETQQDPGRGEIRLLKNFVRFPGARRRVLGPLPALGEHTAEVLAELGFSREQVEAFVQQGAALVPGQKN